MTVVALSDLIRCQNDLIKALDSDSVSALEHATASVAAAIARLTSDPEWQKSLDVGEDVTYALKQAEAAKARVNFLTDRTRQRLERITSARGDRVVQTYGARGKPRNSLPPR